MKRTALLRRAALSSLLMIGIPAIATTEPARPPWVQSGVHLSAPLERMLRAEYAAGVPLPPAAVRRWRLDAPDADEEIAEGMGRAAAEPARPERTAVVGLHRTLPSGRHALAWDAGDERRPRLPAGDYGARPAA